MWRIVVWHYFYSVSKIFKHDLALKVALLVTGLKDHSSSSAIRHFTKCTLKIKISSISKFSQILEFQKFQKFLKFLDLLKFLKFLKFLDV